MALWFRDSWQTSSGNAIWDQSQSNNGAMMVSDISYEFRIESVGEAERSKTARN